MALVSTVMPFILGLIMLVYWRHRKVYRGFGRWVLANFGLSLGNLSIALRNFIPEFFTVMLGNAMIVYSVILIYEGIEQFYGRLAFSRFNYLVFGVYLVM